MSIERAATDGSTIRNIAEALLIRTARQPIDSDRMLEAIHSPAVRKALSSNSPVRKAMLEAPPAPAMSPAEALALVLVHWEPEAALRARGEPEAVLHAPEPLHARAAHARRILAAVRTASAAEISVAVLRSEIAAALVVAVEDSAAALPGRVAAEVLPASVAAEVVDVLAAVAVAHAEAAVAEDEAEAGGPS